MHYLNTVNNVALQVISDHLTVSGIHVLRLVVLCRNDKLNRSCVEIALNLSISFSFIHNLLKLSKSRRCVAYNFDCIHKKPDDCIFDSGRPISGHFLTV